MFLSLAAQALAQNEEPIAASMIDINQWDADIAMQGVNTQKIVALVQEKAQKTKAAYEPQGALIHPMNISSSEILPEHMMQSHEPQEVADWAADERLAEMLKRCDKKKPENIEGLVWEPKGTPERAIQDFSAAAAMRNCKFATAWAYHLELTADAPPTSEVGMARLDTEYKMAEEVWNWKFGDWWLACYPADKYSTVWPGVDGIPPTGYDFGSADCQVEQVNGRYMVTGCKCADLTEDQSEFLSPQDYDLVYNGNCKAVENDHEGATCIQGAVSLANEKGWGQEMRWMAVLMTLRDMLDQFTSSVNLSVDDVYWLMKNYPEAVDDDCVSCQYYSALRPMPMIKGVDHRFILDDMLEFGKITQEDYDMFARRAQEASEGLIE